MSLQNNLLKIGLPALIHQPKSFYSAFVLV